MSVNFGGVDAATGKAVTVEGGELSGDAVGETVAVAAPGRAPTRVGDGVCAWRTATQLKTVKRMAVDLIEELDRIIQDKE